VDSHHRRYRSYDLISMARTGRIHRRDPLHPQRAYCGLTDVDFAAPNDDTPTDDVPDCRACANSAARRGDPTRYGAKAAQTLARQRATRALRDRHAAEYEQLYQQHLTDLLNEEATG
jgi:hypothetical protein